MFKTIILLISIFLYPVILKAEIRSISFDWEYDTNVQKLKGYKLYKNNDLLFHTINDSNQLQITLNVDINPESECFKMKAFSNTNEESNFSEKYCIDAFPMEPKNFKFEEIK